MKTPPELAQAFRARGLKVTPQRETIFGVLHCSDVHPTAESVYALARRRMPTMSLKTVYQTLKDLAQMGEIRQLDLGTGSTRFDPNVDRHHHLVCRACGRVRDLYAVYPGLDVPSGERRGFAVEDAEVVFRGVCAECSASGVDAPRPAQRHMDSANRAQPVRDRTTTRGADG